MGAGASLIVGKSPEYLLFEAAWGSPQKLRELWNELDANGNGIVSLAAARVKT